MHRIIVVVPAYNEAKTVGTVVRELSAVGALPLVVDDGSSDDTGTTAEQAGARVIRHTINLGQGAALATGFQKALSMGADIVVTFDADGQCAAADMSTLIEPIINKSADVVLGTRFKADAHIPFMRLLILKIATLYTRLTARLNVTDTHNGMRAFSRDVIRHLRIEQPKMAHASEILHEIARHKWRYTEVPVTITYSSYSIKKGQRSWAGLKILFDLWFR